LSLSLFEDAENKILALEGEIERIKAEIDNLQWALANAGICPSCGEELTKKTKKIGNQQGVLYECSSCHLMMWKSKEASK